MADSGSSRGSLRPDRSRSVPGGSSRTTASGPVSFGTPPASSTPPLDDERTIISKQPLAGNQVYFGGTHPADLGRMLAGERLGHFDLLEFIGGGGMGAVFRALDTMLNRIVAVKVLSQDQSGDEETLRRFKNEAQSAARLDHENISRVYYVGEDRGLHYIVFEYIEGTNLRDLVERNGPLPLDQAISFMLQIGEALGHASTRDVVHRDIKPSNVLITPQGKAKLVDMGLARLHQVAQPDNDLTASGVTLGTFDYISPEQARDPRSADVRSDLYSLGCTFYYMLTGRPPFPEGTVLQKLLQHQGDEPPDPRDVRPDLPDEILVVLRRLMAKLPSARYQTPADMTAELAALSEAWGLETAVLGSSSRAAALPASRWDWRRHAPWAVPLAVLFLFVVVLNAVSSSKNTETPPAYSIPNKATLVSPAKQNPQPTPEKGAVKGNESRVPSVESVAAKNPKDEAHPAPSFILDTESHSPLHRDPPSATALQPEQVRAALTSSLHAAASTVEELTGTLARATRATGATTPADSAPTVPAARKGTLVVAGPDDDPETFPSLRAACAGAKNNDVIELRFNGRLEEKPFTINNLKLKVRAAEGFQPVLAFKPGGDASGQAHAMLTIAGGQLTLINVSLDFDLPQVSVAESWALFETQRAEAVRLENCWLTIRNAAPSGGAFHRDVAFFDIRAVPGAEVMMPAGMPTGPSLSIELKNCVARGEALFVRSNDLQPFRLQWENGLLATSERLYSADGGEHAARGPSGVEISLRHLTAITRGGLYRLSNSADAPHQLELSIEGEDSIFIGDGTSPLLEQTGIDSAADFEQRIAWSANRNFYEDYNVFWRIRGSDAGDSPKQFSLEDWCEYWGDDHETTPGEGHILWSQSPEAAKPLHQIVPADYTVSPAEENPARGAAGDGRDVGLQADHLPAVPR